MTPEETKLYNELKKLVKRANQRIIRLERLVESQGEFATKQLYDYLTSEKVQAITKQGRIKITGFTIDQMEAIKKATEEFLESDFSKTGTIKKYKAKIEKQVGVKLSYQDISAMYEARELWQWVDETYGSAFWIDFAPRIMTESKNEWVEFAEKYASDGNDIEVRNKLRQIYDYIKKHGLRGVVRFD